MARTYDRFTAAAPREFEAAPPRISIRDRGDAIK
jgi:hypothetical protein